MGSLQALTARDVDLLMRRFSEALTEHRHVLNALNVYPVPDGDTGTNMSLTLQSVVDALPDGADGADAASAGGDGAAGVAGDRSDRDAADMATVCRVIAKESLMAARGNSGVILSQFMRALVADWAEVPKVDASRLAQSLQVSAEAAYKAVQRPVEGTILTVGKDLAAAAVTAADTGASLVEVVEAALQAGHESLARTPDLLAVLRVAGVVDAGGQGLLLLLDALLTVVDGRPLPEAPEVVGHSLPADHQSHDPHDAGATGGGDIADLRYEVMFLLHAPDEQIAAFRERWSEIGDSIVVVGGDGLWNCHIHTDDIGGAIEAGIDVGTPRRIEVTDLLDQVAHTEHVAVPVRTTSGVVAVAAGEGVRGLFEALGAGEIVLGGQTMNPSAADLLAAVERSLAEQVVVLPNNKNIVPVAQQLQELTDKPVEVVATQSIPAGLSAMLEFDPDAPAEENAARMAEQADMVVAGEVTQAVRDAATPEGEVQEGDFMGLSAAGIECTAAELTEAACGLLERIVDDDHEIVTLIAGAEATEEDTEALVEWLGENRPHIEVEVHAGGQPLYHYYVGVE